MRKILLALFISVGVSSAAPATAKNLILVLPPNYAGSKTELIDDLGNVILALGPSDHLLIEVARPAHGLADISVPDGPNAANRAWVKQKLAEQAAPAIDYIDAMPVSSMTEPPGNLMIPDVIDELVRNAISSHPEAHTDILLLGSPLYFDIRDDRWSMTDRFYPADGFLRTDPSKFPFGIEGWRRRLKDVTLHICSAGTNVQYVSHEHKEAVKRWWSLWTTGQAGRVGTFSDDLGTCMRRFMAGDGSGQQTYQPSRDTKPEMIRARLPVPSTLPASMAEPGAYFLRDDVPISHTPPLSTVGVAWIGATWKVDCDLDLHARADAESRWLYWGNVRSHEGFFNKDWREGTAHGQFEFVEFTKPIDLMNAEIEINIYAGNLSTPPEGKVRLWFGGRVYEAPFKLSARSGNKGQGPMTGPFWVSVDLRSMVGLPTVPDVANAPEHASRPSAHKVTPSKPGRALP